MKEITLILVTIILGFHLGFSQTGWTEAAKKKFLRECKKESKNLPYKYISVEHCDCVLEKLPMRCPESSEMKHLTEEDWKDMNQECIDNESQSIWKEEDKLTFLKSCIEESEVKVGKETATKNCKCALRKIIEICPDPSDVDKIAQEEFIEIVTGCINEAEWDEEVQDVFLKTCIDGSKGSLGKDKAEEYCYCVLMKVMKKSPDPVKASEITEEEMSHMAADCMEE
jgi:hypothetical protein